jgi:hypothetical protein
MQQLELIYLQWWTHIMPHFIDLHLGFTIWTWSLVTLIGLETMYFISLFLVFSHLKTWFPKTTH